MPQHERNEYVDSIIPILYLLKIIGLLPFRLNAEDDIPRFIESKILSTIFIGIYVLSLIINARRAYQIMNILSTSFTLKIFLSMMPYILIKIFMVTIPLHMWNKSQHLHDYWSNWKTFQEDYRRITGSGFQSMVKNSVRWIVVVVGLLIISGVIIGQFSIYHGANHLTFVSDFFNIATIYFIGSYWMANCIYIRSVARDILALGKGILIRGHDHEKLRKITLLWLSLSELMHQFDTLHSILFLQYVTAVIISVIIFAFISMNTSTIIFHSRVAQSNGLIICTLLMFGVCETAHSVRQQINDKQIVMLLRENTMRMNARMLRSVLSFLQTIQLKNPQINLNGYLIVNRSVFSSILAACINYLIILRQFATTKSLESAL